MIARLLISRSLESRKEAIDQMLTLHLGKATTVHPDLLYFKSDVKLGIEQARQIKAHFSLKPFLAKVRTVILEDAGNLTADAQNALLKILEETPENGILILSADSRVGFLPTVLSRCQIIDLAVNKTLSKSVDYIAKLVSSNIDERFDYIEKCKDREEFLQDLTTYFHQNLRSIGSGDAKYLAFLKELLQAEQWAKANVNIRAILEYLMLVMPKQK